MMEEVTNLGNSTARNFVTYTGHPSSIVRIVESRRLLWAGYVVEDEEDMKFVQDFEGDTSYKSHLED
jgi:hypothetical protein